MFQKICIKPNDQTFPTDIGFIAENLLYYQNVDIIAGTDTIPILVNNCGVDTIIELLTNRNLRILLRENLLGVANQQTNIGQTLTDVMLVSSPNLTKEEMIFRGIFQASGRRGYSKRVTQKLMPYVETIRYQNDICDLVREDINNSSYFKQAIIDTVKFYNPALTLRQEEIDYSFIKTNGGFLFQTNLNYELINKNIPNNPDGKLINPTGLILNILETRGDMHLASELNAEIATSSIHTELMKIKFHDIYKRTTQSSTELFQFNDFVLSHGHAIREIINNGDKNFSDFFNVLDKADKFREWLKDIGEDKSVIQEYHKAVTSETWVDKLPSKVFRWSFFTGAGIALDVLATGGIGTAVGLGLSVGDAFLLDKIIKGWKPNVFVENELKNFVEEV
jgi:hypothetical protein